MYLFSYRDDQDRTVEWSVDGTTFTCQLTRTRGATTLRGAGRDRDPSAAFAAAASALADWERRNQ